MSDGTNLLSPWPGVTDAEWARLVTRGRERGHLALDDVLETLSHVELTEDVITAIRAQFADAGIE
ncbi:MAG: RNA polymerase sigma factor region1.1 domain-containing protein, partial [Acidimicrobiales bacterium]|nr:RNA polymerase sigma factor region1.1 domain-containing protein [Acidimicrobiales bacterium]